LAFEQINEVTWKLTDGRGSNAWSGNRGGGYRTTRAVAWLKGVGDGKWIVRYRNKASKPMRLAKAREYALEMVRGIRAGRVLTDPIRTLHQEHLKTMEEEPRPAPLHIMGGGQEWNNSCRVERETATEILRSECPMLVDAPIKPALTPPLQGDDCPLEFYPDGYPMLPDGLKR
jgi:hypothetical protein